MTSIILTCLDSQTPFSLLNLDLWSAFRTPKYKFTYNNDACVLVFFFLGSRDVPLFLPQNQCRLWAFILLTLPINLIIVGIPLFILQCALSFNPQTSLKFLPLGKSIALKRSTVTTNLPFFFPAKCIKPKLWSGTIV